MVGINGFVKQKLAPYYISGQISQGNAEVKFPNTTGKIIVLLALL